MIDKLTKLGFGTQVDQDMGTIFIAKFESCQCCSGFVNNCKGQECDFLGLCYCVSAFMHDGK